MPAPPLADFGDLAAVNGFVTAGGFVRAVTAPRLSILTRGAGIVPGLVGYPYYSSTY